MSDVSSGVTSVQDWMTSVESTMGNLASQMQAAVPSGNFAAVLASVQALFSSPASSPATSGAAVGSSVGDATIGAQLSDPGSSNPTGVSGSAVAAEATQFLGVPYVWGGSTPSGFDCSGLVQYVYGQLGVSLPRTSQEQAQVGTLVSSLADAQAGDLVFYAGSDGTVAAPGHVGIYLGNGEMIDAPQTGETVSIQAVGSPVAIRRVLPEATDPVPSTGTGAIAAAPGSLLGAAPGTSSTSGAPASAAATAATSSSAVPADLAPLFVAAAGRYGVPVTLLTAVSRTESGFDPNAVSSAGAEGLMQLMPATAAGLGVDPFDPTQAIDGAAQLLSGYLKQFGSLPLALAAYNAGAGAVEQYGGVPPYPQTEAYVQSITQALQGAS